MSFKRGSALDLPIGMALILASALTFLILNTIVNTLSDQGGIFDRTEWTTFVNNSFGLLDGLFVFGFFSLFLAAIVMAAVTRSTPIMFGVGVLMVIVSVFLAPTIANIYYEVATNPDISGGHSNIDSFFSNLPLIVLVVGGVIIVVNLMGGRGYE